MAFNYRIIFKILSTVSLIIGFTMLIPCATAIYYSETQYVRIFLQLSFAIIIISSAVRHGITYAIKYIRLRDGSFIMVGTWILAALLGSLPYLISGYTDSFVDAFFESTAAFTTTGATVLNLDSMPHCLLMWRSVCSWLGGIGVLVLSISLIPALGLDGKTFVQSEGSAAFSDRISNKASETISYLWAAYIIFTLLELILLKFSAMNNFDVIINTLNSVSTSGIPSSSHAFHFYEDTYIEGVMTTFALLASVNFTLYFALIHGNWQALLHNIELRAFLIMVAISIVLVSLNLHFAAGYDIVTSLRYGIFQCSAMASTSSMAITGFEVWPAFSLTILLVLSMIGGCTFSTCSSIKVQRILIFLKLIIRGIYRRVHPRSVVAIKVGKKVISAQKASNTTAYILFYIFVIMMASIVLSLQNLSFETTLTTSVAMLTNSGMGLGETATGDFSMYNYPLRLVLCFLMFAGRLDLFTFTIVFMPSFWNPEKYRFHLQQ